MKDEPDIQSNFFDLTALCLHKEERHPGISRLTMKANRDTQSAFARVEGSPTLR